MGGELGVIIKGLGIGFALALPVGPVGILCINRSISRGQVAGVATGAGAAMADTFYGLIAVLGLTFISDFLEAQRLWLQIIGGLFLLILGYKIYIKKAEELHGESNGNTHHTLIHDFLSAIIITFSNPGTILAFLAMFTGYGFSLKKIESGTTWFVISVFIGSMVWWFILTSLVSIFRKKINGKLMHRLNQISGGAIMAFGLLIFMLLFYTL